MSILPAAALFCLVCALGCVVCGLIERRQEIAEDKRRRAALFYTGGILK